MFRVVGLGLLGLTMAAQTRIDLRSQAKTVDFSVANSTKPMKMGPELPPTCAVGEMFLKSNAPAGTNVYACTASNTWSAQGANTVQSNGVVVGRQGATNFVAGAGLISLASDTGSQIDMMWALDPAVAQTQAGEQSGAALWCSSTSQSGSNYECSMTPAAAAYSSGMVLHWRPDVNGAGGPTTLNVDMLGAAPVKGPDGSSDPAPSDILAGRLYDIWYDGAQFRLMASMAEAVSDPGANGVVYRSAAGSASAATADQMSGPFFCQDTSSTAGAYACDLSPAISGYTAGTTYWFRANAANTGAATINFNSLGAKAIKKQSNADLAAGDIAEGQWVMLTYDGTSMQMLSQTAAPAGTGTVAAHAATHRHGGSDEVATATAAANGIPKAGADGKLAPGWLPAPGASTLGGVQATDCSATGLVQKINSDGTVTCAAGSAFDISRVMVVDDFACGGSAGPCLPWYIWGTGSANAAASGTWPHLGVYKVGGTATAAGNNGYISLMSSSSGVPALGMQSGFAANGPWEAHWIFQLNQTTDTRAYVTFHSHGVTGLDTYSPIGLRYDTQLGDTNFMFVANPGWSGGALSTGVAADTNWHHLKVYWVSAGRIGLVLDGGPVKTACASGCDITVTVWSPSIGVVPAVYCGSDTIAQLTTMNVDYFGYIGQVGAR